MTIITEVLAAWARGGLSFHFGYSALWKNKADKSFAVYKC